MSKAAKTCSACSGRGRQLLMSGGDVVCSICNGTGITTTGKFLGTLPSTPNPVTDEPHEPTITTTQGDAPSVVTGNGLRYVYAPGHDSGATVNATGHDGCIRGLEKAKAEAEYLRNKLHETERAGDIRIAEQAAEIERLRERVNGLEQLHASWADGSLAELTAERDALRAAVDHLKAERDELKGKLDVQQEFIDDYRKTIDRLRTEVERLKGERDSVKRNFASLVAATEQGVDRIRAEKYLAVIEAGDHERLAIIAMHNAAMRAQGARSIAGLPAYVHEPSQEATCDERS